MWPIALNSLEHKQQSTTHAGVFLGLSWVALLCTVSLQDTQPSSFKGNLEKACPHPQRTVLSILDLLQVKRHQDIGWVICNSAPHALKATYHHSAKDIHFPQCPPMSSPQITVALQSLSNTATAPFAGRKLSLSLPSQFRCWQSAEPGGDLKETTFLPLLRNPERYQSTTPMFPFPKDGLGPDREQLSHHANALAAGCLGQERLGLQPKGRRSASFS